MTADPYVLAPLSADTGVVFEAAGGTGYAVRAPDGLPAVQRRATLTEAAEAAAGLWGMNDMPVTQEQINAAADALALGKLQATMQREEAAAAVEWRSGEKLRLAEESRKMDEYRAANLALLGKQTAAAEAIVALNRDVSDGLLTRDQAAFADLFKLCLEARRVPLTTASTDTAMADIMRDAMYMATFAWPSYKAQLDALAAQAAAANAV